MRIASIASAACVLAAGCGGGPTLAVDLRTDWVPGIEFAGVRVELEGAEPADVLAFPSDDYLRGQRVAELRDLPSGQSTLHVTLHVPETGAVLDRRSVLVDTTSARVVTVLVPRRPGTCGRDADCADVAACASAVCVEAACLAAPVPGACDDGEYCDPGLGCRRWRTPDDAGLPDAGRDAGLPDAGHDAGHDAGPGCPDVTGAYAITSPAPCEELDGLAVDVDLPDPARPCEVRFVPAPGGSMSGLANVTRAGLVDGVLDLTGVARNVPCTGPWLDGHLSLFCRELTDCVVELAPR